MLRLSEDAKTATYQVFGQWLGPARVISEEDRKTLLEEDEAFDYRNHGVGSEEKNNRQHFEDSEQKVSQGDIVLLKGMRTIIILYHSSVSVLNFSHCKIPGSRWGCGSLLLPHALLLLHKCF